MRTFTSRGLRRGAAVVAIGALLSGCGIRDLVGGRSPSTVAAPTPTPTESTPSMPPVETSTTAPVEEPSLQPIPSLGGPEPTPSPSATPALPSGYRWVKDWRTGYTFPIRKDVQVADPAKVAKTGKAPSNWTQLAGGQRISVKEFAKKHDQILGLGKAHYVSNDEYWMLIVATSTGNGPFRATSLTASQVKRSWTPAKGKGKMRDVTIVDTSLGRGLLVSRAVQVDRPIGQQWAEQRSLLLTKGSDVAVVTVSDSAPKVVDKEMKAIVEGIHQGS